MKRSLRVKPVAYLFSNGNAVYFDDEGKQIPELQLHNWKGLHEFVKRYPTASVHIQYSTLDTPEAIERVLSQIKQSDFTVEAE